MRRFTSYGPPRPGQDFMVERTALVEKVAAQLVGDPEAGGHYFTVFAPRQAGKTTTLRQVQALLQEQVGDRFHVGFATMHLIHDLREGMREIFYLAFGMDIPPVTSWEGCKALFQPGGPLKRPVLLVLTFPELESHPLLVKLQKVFPPVE